MCRRLRVSSFSDLQTAHSIEPQALVLFMCWSGKLRAMQMPGALASLMHWIKRGFIAAKHAMIAAAILLPGFSPSIRADSSTGSQWADYRRGVPQAASSGETDTIPLERLHLGTAYEQGRPARFYQLSISNRPAVCELLDTALNEHQPKARSKAELLLGNQYTVSWTDLAGFSLYPVSRTTVDLNHDGKQDVLYRETYSLAGETLQGLYWTDKYPTGETTYSLTRFREITSRKLPEAKWSGAPATAVLIWSPRYEPAAAEYVSTINPPMPDRVNTPLGSVVDVVRVHGRDLLILAPSDYVDRPLELFVFESRGPRDHSLICLFKGNFILTEP